MEHAITSSPASGELDQQRSMQQLNTKRNNGQEQNFPPAISKTRVALLRVGGESLRATMPRMVTEIFMNFEVHQVSEACLLQDQLADRDFGCFLLEYEGGDAALAEMIDLLSQQIQGVALIVIGRSPSIAQAVMALKMGVADYIDGSLANDEALAAGLLESVQSALAASAARSSQPMPLALVSATTPFGAYSEDAAHAVLTPLAALQELIALVLDGVVGPIGDQQGKHLAYARGACDQIRQAVDHFIGVNGLNPNYFVALAPQLLEPILLETWSDLNARGVGDNLNLELDESVATQLVTADPILLQQVFRTLLQDCSTYAEPGETIAVSAQVFSLAEEAELQVSLCTKPLTQPNAAEVRTFINRRRFGPWLITQTLDEGLRYQLDLPAAIQSERAFSTNENKEF